MATKKYLSYDGLAEYDALIKAEITDGKAYADNAANTVKNDLLNGAGEAYDTLKELADLITENVDAIDALEIVATGKADAEHSHAIADVSNLQSALDKKSNSGHNHSAAAITQGTLNIARFPTVTIAKGGTGATDAETARANLGVPSIEEMNAAITSIPTPDVSGQISTHNTDTTAHADIRELIDTLGEEIDGLQGDLNAKQNTLTFDNAPTSGSTNPVTSTGIHVALQDKASQTILREW